MTAAQKIPPEKKKKPKKKKGKSPTQLTLEKWRDRGYMCAIVEKWNPHARVRQDLFGFVDVLAVGNGETIGIQTTDYTSVSKRIRKIEDDPETVRELRKAGWRIIIEGWRKPQHRWKCREVELS